jgi:ribosomal protein L11 methylase PrmA
LILHKADGCVTANDFSSEIILANINFNVIIDNLEAIKTKATKNAIVLFSGILEGDIPNLSKELTKGGFYIHEVNFKNGWAMIYSRLN